MKSVPFALAAMLAIVSPAYADELSPSLVSKVVVNATLRVVQNADNGGGESSVQLVDLPVYSEFSDFREESYAMSLRLMNILKTSGFIGGAGYHETQVYDDVVYFAVDKKTGAVSVEEAFISAKFLYDSEVKEENCLPEETLEDCMNRLHRQTGHKYRKSCMIEIPMKNIQVKNNRVVLSFQGCEGVVDFNYEARVDQIWKSADLDSLPGLLPRK